MGNRTGRSRAVAVMGATLLILVAAACAGCGDPDTTASSDSPGEKRTLLVATAASLKAAFTEIGAAFDQAGGSETTFTFDTSGSLQKQIEGGAPVDVFVSASPVQVDNLLAQSLVDEGSITTFASNEMVLGVPADSTLPIDGFDDLTRNEIERITTADPETAPQGKTALEVLTHLGLLETVQPKFVYAKNSSQTLTYVAQGEVDAGIMFATDAISGGDSVRVVATAEPGWHSEIAYVMALVSESPSKDLGQSFLDFVAGETGRSILAKHGFILP